MAKMMVLEDLADELRPTSTPETLRVLTGTGPNMDPSPEGNAKARFELAEHTFADAFEPVQADLPDTEAPAFDDLTAGLPNATDRLQRAAAAGAVYGRYLDRARPWLEVFDAALEVAPDVQRAYQLRVQLFETWNPTDFLAVAKQDARKNPALWRLLQPFVKRLGDYCPPYARDWQNQFIALATAYTPANPQGLLDEATFSLRMTRARLRSVLTAYVANGSAARTIPGE